jgi:hypothetical protein
MTAGRPAGALRKEIGVIDVAYENVAGNFLLLEVTLQTESIVTLIQHALIDGAVRRMADHTSFA